MKHTASGEVRGGEIRKGNRKRLLGDVGFKRLLGDRNRGFKAAMKLTASERG